MTHPEFNRRLFHDPDKGQAINRALNNLMLVFFPHIKVAMETRLRKEVGSSEFFETELNRAAEEFTAQLIYLWISTLVDFMQDDGELNCEQINEDMWPWDSSANQNVEMFFSMPALLSEDEVRQIWKEVKNSLPEGLILHPEAQKLLQLAGFKVLYAVK